MSDSHTKTGDPVVDIEVWEPNPDEPGYLRFVRRKPVREVFEAVRAIIGESPAGCNEYFMLTASLAKDIAQQPWPVGRTIVWAHTGGSEGHYSNIDVITNTGRYIPLITGKTFDGWDACWDFAKRVAAILAV